MVIECAPGRLLRSIVAPLWESGKTAVVLSAGCAARQRGPDYACETKWRSDRGAHRGADRPRRRDGSRGRKHPFGQDGDQKAGSGARRRSLYRRKQHRHRTHYRAAQDIRGTAREAAKGFPANLNVAVALSLAASAPTPNAAGNLGRSHGDAQHASCRSRIRFRPFFDVDREYPVGKSEDGAHYRALPSSPIFASSVRLFVSVPEAEAQIFYFDAFSLCEPVSTQDQSRAGFRSKTLWTTWCHRRGRRRRRGGQDVGVFVSPLVDGGEPDRNVRVNATHALYALRHANQAHQPMSFAPRSFSRSTAATAEFAVASTGEITITCRSCKSLGALKKYSTATKVSGSR